MKQALEFLKAKFFAFSLKERALLVALMALVALGAGDYLFRIRPSALSAGSTVIIPHSGGNGKYGATGDNAAGIVINTSTGHLDLNTHKILNQSNGTASTDGANFGQIPTASTATPAPLGTAAVGSGTTWAKADHVHAMPTLDAVGAPVASVGFNSQKGINVANGTAAQDVAAFNQIAAALNASTYKNTVNARATANQATLTGLAQTVDGVALSSAGMRVLLDLQTTTTQDACYVVASGAWTLCPEMTTGASASGAVFVVESGSTNSGVWVDAQSGAQVVGTNDLLFTKVSGSGGGAPTFTQVQTALAAATSAVGFNLQELVSIASPTAPTSAVDGLTLNAHMFRVAAATTTTLPAYTRSGSGSSTILTANANGAFPAIDNFTLTANAIGLKSVLLLNGAAASDNGIWDLTQQGDAGTPWILTISQSMNTAAQIQGSKVRVRFGVGNGSSEWEYVNAGAITLGTTSLYWVPTTRVDPAYIVDRVDNFDWVSGAGITTNGAVTPGPIGWSLALVGASAAFTAAGASATEFGAAQLISGASTTGSCGIYLPQKPARLTNTNGWYESFRFSYPALSDGTNTYSGQIGVSDASGTVAGGNGVWIEYKQATDTHLRCTGMVSATPVTATGATLNAATYYRGTISKLPGDTTAHIYIDGAECGTGFTTGQWPSAVAVTPFAAVTKSAGTASNTLNIASFRYQEIWPGRTAP